MMIDNATPLLSQIIQISGGAANEALGKAGYKLQKGMQSRAKSMGTLQTHQRFVNGRRRLTSSKDGYTKSIYSRYSKSNDSELGSMADLIRFKVYDESHKVLVGFMDVRGWSPTRYKYGKASGKMPYVKGTGRAKSKDPNSMSFKEIGQLYEYGGNVTLTEKQKRLFMASGWGKAAKRGFVRREAHPIVNPTFRAKEGEVIGVFKKTYIETIVNLSSNSTRVRAVS